MHPKRLASFDVSPWSNVALPTRRHTILGMRSSDRFYAWLAVYITVSLVGYVALFVLLTNG